MEKIKDIKVKTLRQSVLIKAEPHEIYETLMDSKKHSKLIHSRAHMSNKVGGEFSAFDKYITGKNLKLVPDKKIVQAWHGSDWPEGHFSKATFLLKKEKDGTKLVFTQTGIPIKHFADISEGWQEHYWEPMKEMLGC